MKKQSEEKKSGNDEIIKKISQMNVDFGEQNDDGSDGIDEGFLQIA